MTAYELMIKREQLKEQLSNLTMKTNGPMGKDPYLWDLIGEVSKKIGDIEETLKAVVIR